MYQRIHVVFPDGVEAVARISDSLRWTIEPNSYTPRDSSRMPGEIAERELVLDEALEAYLPDIPFDVQGGGLPTAYNVGPMFELKWPGTRTLESVPAQAESLPGRVY